MDKIEASGRTLEEALQMAATQLKVGVDAVDYEIVEEGSKGFLGLGQVPTVIQAWVKEGYEPAVPPMPQPEEAAVVEKEIEIVEIKKESEEQVAEKAEPEAKPEPAKPAAAFSNALVRILSDVINAMGLDAKPVIKSADSEEVTVEIVGKDVSVLIGKHGQTLDALQYLVSIGANRASGERMRVILDAEGYRERHRQMLEKIAHEYAESVKAQGQEAVLEPQSARDRRIIHMALVDDPDVYTYSEGEGHERHVVISPKK